MWILDLKILFMVLPVNSWQTARPVTSAPKEEDRLCIAYVHKYHVWTGANINNKEGFSVSSRAVRLEASHFFISFKKVLYHNASSKWWDKMISCRLANITLYEILFLTASMWKVKVNSSFISSYSNLLCFLF